MAKDVLLRRTFRRNSLGGMWSRGKPGLMVLCRFEFFKQLRQWFHLPTTARKVTVCLYRDPGTSRVMARVADTTYAGNPRLRSLEGHRGIIEDFRIDNLLLPLVGQTVYIQVEYE